MRNVIDGRLGFSDNVSSRFRPLATTRLPPQWEIYNIFKVIVVERNRIEI